MTASPTWLLGSVALVPAGLVVFVVLFGPTSTPRKEQASALSGGDARKARPALLILDPGHGGKDRGGYNRTGFLHDGQRIPEDAYTFDVVARIATTASARGWETFLTVTDAVYNLQGTRTAVFPGEAGLRLRLDAVREALDRFPGSKTVFISLHFDDAPPGVSGAKIYTAPELAAHPFVTILSKTLLGHDLGYRNHHGPLSNVDASQKFIVLAEGVVEPRVLVELGNFNNSEDRARILSASGRQKYADVVIEALSKYLSGTNEALWPQALARSPRIGSTHHAEGGP